MNRRWTRSLLLLSLLPVACGDDPRSEGDPTSTSVTTLSGTSADDDDDDDDDDDNDDDTSVTSSTSGSNPTDTGDTGDTGDTDDPSAGDSTTDAPPPGGPCGGADILCDDFEGGGSLSADWAYTGSPANMPIIDQSYARSGTGSLTFPTTDTQGAFVYPVAGLPVASNRVYVRAHVSFERNMSEMGGHVSYIVGADQPANGAELRLGASQNFGNGQMMVDINLLGSGPEYTQFSNGDVTGGAPSANRGVTLVASTWYCMEALFDGEADEFRLWVDGEELIAIHVTDWQQGVMDWSPTYNVIKLGGQNYSGSLGQVWFDDVAIGTQPLGCP